MPRPNSGNVGTGVGAERRRRWGPSVAHKCKVAVTTVATGPRRHNLTVGLDGNGVSLVITTTNSRGHLAVTVKAGV